MLGWCRRHQQQEVASLKE